MTTGLMAGLFYAYSISVMPALRATPAPVLTEVMQRINRAIVNGWFLLAFAGALVTGVLAVVLVVPAGNGRALPWAVAGLVLYARGRARSPSPVSEAPVGARKRTAP